MSETATLALAAFAGATILLGLAAGRLRHLPSRARQFLSAVAIGVLLFLAWDVLSGGYQPVAAALARWHGQGASGWPAAGYGTLLLGGTGVGLVSLLYAERLLDRRRAGFGPGTMAVAEGRARHPGQAGWPPGQRLALLIAIGIGLHNLGEGLAIGGSAARGELSLATLLVIGFALHNATEGFGILAPLATAATRPGWRFLAGLGAIGGGPTFVGALIGRQFTSAAVSTLFLALAGGSILYVVLQLAGVAHRAGRRELLIWGVFIGLVAGFVTDMAVTAAGA